MNFWILFSLFTLIVSAPANVLVVTKVKYQTVVVGNQNTQTLTSAAVSSEPLTSTITKTLTRTTTKDGQVEVEETEVELTVTPATTDATTTGSTEATTTEADAIKAATDSTEATTEATTEVATEVATTSTASSTSSTSSTSGSTSTGTDSPDSGSHSGEGTYYDTGLGACGITNKDTDYIVAISHELFDETDTGNPNNNPVCGKKIQAHYQGKSVEVTVTDRCEGCAYNDLDFSPSAFSDIADKSLGRIDITWDWIN